VTNFADGPVAYSLEIVLAIVKLFAATTERYLPGLAAMGPGVERAVMNPTVEYAAPAGNCQPDPARDNGFFTGRFIDSIVDRVFAKNGNSVPNDLVVPTHGRLREERPWRLPHHDRLLFGASDHVRHGGLFEQARTHEHLLKFFARPMQRSVERSGARPASGFPRGRGEWARRSTQYLRDGNEELAGRIRSWAAVGRVRSGLCRSRVQRNHRAVLASERRIGGRVLNGFYEKLIAGRSIGEALQELRTEHADDPTFLTYSYFAIPSPTR
jgi:hypothetical protein